MVAEFRAGKEKRFVEAEAVVGADGAGSTTRQLLGVGLKGV